MFGKALFVYVICGIVGFASVDGQIVVAMAAIATGLSFMWQLYDTSNRMVDMYNNHTHMSIDDLYVSLVHNIKEITESIEHMVVKEEKVIEMQQRMYEFQNNAKLVEDGFNDFLRMIKKNPDPKTKGDFAVATMNANDGIARTYENIFINFAGLGVTSLIYLLKDTYEDVYPYCSTSKSEQRFFYDLFLATLGAYYKCHAMMRYSNQIHRDVLGYHDYADRMELLNSQTQTRVNTTLQVILPIIAAASQDMHRCDLQKNHKEEQTYTQLKNLFTRVYVFGKDITRHKPNACFSHCPSDENIIGEKCFGECGIRQRKCNRLVHCHHAKKHYLCLEEDQTKIQRYSLVKNDYSSLNKFLGNQEMKGCKNEFFISNDFPCVSESVCDCICDESEHSDRHFSLDDVLSNVEENYVITGVRFVKKNSIVKIQIQEGKLLPYGFIDQQTVNWTSTGTHEDYTTFDQFGKTEILDDDAELLTDDRRHHNITWSVHRGIFLDNIDLPDEHILTGVRFSTDTIGDKTYLKIQISSTEFDFISGKLSNKSSEWRSNYAKYFEHNVMDVSEYSAPTSIEDFHKLDPVNQKITYFTPTAVTSPDAGSTVVPYLDIQPLLSSVAVPLSSLGLGYLGAERSGGYLVLKTRTYNVSRHIP